MRRLSLQSVSMNHENPDTKRFHHGRDYRNHPALVFCGLGHSSGVVVVVVLTQSEVLMFSIFKRHSDRQRKDEIIKRKCDEQLKKEINELMTRINFEQECG